MNSSSEAQNAGEAAVALEIPELSDFELQVQWSEFVPHPMRMLLSAGSAALAALSD